MLPPQVKVKNFVYCYNSYCFSWCYIRDGLDIIHELKYVQLSFVNYEERGEREKDLERGCLYVLERKTIEREREREELGKERIWKDK